MAGYSKFYVFGGAAGFQGADGVNPIAFLVLVGEGDMGFRFNRFQLLFQLGVLLSQGTELIVRRHQMRLQFFLVNLHE